MVASSNVIGLFTHRAALRRARRPARALAVYQEVLDARANSDRHFFVFVVGATAAILAMVMVAF